MTSDQPTPPRETKEAEPTFTAVVLLGIIIMLAISVATALIDK